MTLEGFAQAYVPFPTDSARWLVDYCHTCNEEPSMPVFFEIKGDTIIDGKLYSNVYQFSTHLIGFLREEAKRVYFKSTFNLAEQVVFDFNLIVGDTIVMPDFGGGTQLDSTERKLGIAYVDSIQINDGSYRKRYELKLEDLNTGFFSHLPYALCYQGENLYWVEGIGGLFESPFYFLSNSCPEEGTAFLCFEQEGVAILGDCTINSIAETTCPDIEVYPTITSNFVWLETSNTLNICVVIYSLMGEVMFYKKLNTPSKLDLSTLPVGIYYLYLMVEQDKIIKKLIKT